MFRAMKVHYQEVSCTIQTDEPSWLEICSLVKLNYNNSAFSWF